MSGTEGFTEELMDGHLTAEAEYAGGGGRSN